MSSDLILHVTDADFKESVLESELPVLVDFWASWCGPCRMIAPILDELAHDYEGKIKIVKLDVENNPGIPAELGIRNIPTLKIFKDGVEVANKVGSSAKSQLAAFIDASI